jgi:hypothetical protein
MAIEYAPRVRTRNVDTVAKLREMADDRPLEPVVAIERAAARIATEMKAIHGGHWTIDINHDAAFVSVSRDWAR